MGPVFLFYVGVIVFVIGSAAGESYRMFSLGKVSEEVVIKELRSVVAIEAEKGEGQQGFDVFDLFEDAMFSLAPYRSLFRPAGGDIDAVKSIDKHSGKGFSAMGDGIGFKEAGVGLVPLVGLDGDVFSEKGSWLGGGTGSFLVLDTDGTQESVDGCC